MFKTQQSKAGWLVPFPLFFSRLPSGLLHFYGTYSLLPLFSILHLAIEVYVLVKRCLRQLCLNQIEEAQMPSHGYLDSLGTDLLL